MIHVPWELRGDHPAQLKFLTEVQANGCWHFQGSITAQGYGRLGRRQYAHRLAWTLAHEQEVPQGLAIDHTCHNSDLTCPANNECLHRRCVNPDHLEAVSPRTNALRGRSLFAEHARLTHCPKGHPYSGPNLYVRPDGYRDCKTCAQQRREPPAGHLEERRRAISKMLSEHPEWSNSEIAQALGVNHKTVRRIRLGIPLRRQRIDWLAEDAS